MLVVMEHRQYFMPLNHGTIDMVTALCFLLETVARLYQKYVNCEQTSAAHENCRHPEVRLEWKHQQLTKMLTILQKGIITQFNASTTELLNAFHSFVVANQQDNCIRKDCHWSIDDLWCVS